MRIDKPEVKNVLTFTGTSSGLITIQPTSGAAGTYTLTLPTDDGTPSQFLQTDGSGVLSWATVSTALGTSLTLSADTTLTADYGLVLPDHLTIQSGKILTMGSGSILAII